MLWLFRNATVHKRQQLTTTQVRVKNVDAALRQLQAVAEHRRRTAARRLNGTCMAQCLEALERADHDDRTQTRQRLTIHFDGGARGNPGPGGSGWALTQATEDIGRLLECGSAFGGTMTTNNRCEYAGLKRGLVAAKRRTDRGTTDLIIAGHSKIIIASHKGVAVISHHNLRDAVNSVNALLRHFGLVHWRHVLRKLNKMADNLANVTMDSHQTVSYNPQTRLPSAQHFETTAALLKHDYKGLQRLLILTSHREITLTHYQRAIYD